VKKNIKYYYSLDLSFLAHVNKCAFCRIWDGGTKHSQYTTLQKKIALPVWNNLQNKKYKNCKIVPNMCLWLNLTIIVITHNRNYSKLPRWSDFILNDI